MYWFLYIDIIDEPYGITYMTETIILKKSYFLKLRMGFKEPHLIDVIMKRIHKDLTKTVEILGRNVFFVNSGLPIASDFKYILINSRVATDYHLSIQEIFAIRVYRFLKSIDLSAMDNFGLDTSSSVE